MTKLLLQKGRADFNMGYPEIENYNILVKAYRQDCRMSGLGETSLEFVKLMLKAGADVNTTFASETENKGLLPELIARGDVEGVKYLLEETEDDIKKRHGEDGLYPIEIAVEDFNGETDLEVLRLLCEAGADVNSFSSNGRHDSVLAGACSPHRYLAMDNGKENPKAVAIVLNAGAVVDTQLTHGEYGSALAVAAKESQGTEILQLLLDAGADVNMPLENESYGSAILAAQEDDSDDYEKGILQALVDGGATKTSHHSTARYRSALIAASCFGQYQAVEYLINAGVAVEDEHSGDYTTAIEAAEAPFSEADKACIVRFCKYNEASAEALLETWGKQKGDVFELLKEAMPPPEVIEYRKSNTITGTCRTYTTEAVTCYSEMQTATSSGVPCFKITVGPKRLRSGNYIV